jgi:hypothetical protein
MSSFVDPRAAAVVFWRKRDKNFRCLQVLSDQVFEVWRGEGRAAPLWPFGSPKSRLRRCLFGKQIWGLHDYGLVRIGFPAKPHPA